MSRTELASASDLLETAASDADADAAERLSDLADQLGRLAEADRGPDHGRLARIQIGLNEVQAQVADDVSGQIENALDEIRSYRETVEGV